MHRTRPRLLLGIGLLSLLGIATALGACGSLERDANELAVGAAVPQAELLDTEGRPYSLASLNPKGLRVLVFYRGAW